MRVYTFNDRELEDFADQIKVLVCRSLVGSNLLSEEYADTWCAEHTLISRKKSIFRTLSSLWKNEEERDGQCWMVVKS